MYLFLTYLKYVIFFPKAVETFLGKIEDWGEICLPICKREICISNYILHAKNLHLP